MMHRGIVLAVLVYLAAVRAQEPIIDAVEGDLVLTVTEGKQVRIFGGVWRCRERLQARTPRSQNA